MPALVQLLSVNVCLPKSAEIDGHTIWTGIFKQPVDGPVMARFRNLDGDGQGNLSVHGGPDKAVYAYTQENVDFWREHLGRETLRPGLFGENLTVQGLREVDILIGDELEIRSARFLVTQPRIPCSKLSAAVGVPEFHKRFLESGRTGFYLRVLQEGVVKAGDSIRRIESKAAARVTIADFARIYRTRQATQDELRELTSLRALPDSMKDWLARKFPA